MVEVDVVSDVVAADEFKDPVKIEQSDYETVRRIRVLVDSLGKYRGEMGRLVQVILNLAAEANATEQELSTTRTALAKKYNLEQIGVGQWAIDFEKREFVKTAPGTPVIA